MEYIRFNGEWLFTQNSIGGSGEVGLIPPENIKVDLPFDWKSSTLAVEHDSTVGYFFKYLPKISASKVSLCLSGAIGVAEVYLNNSRVGYESENGYDFVTRSESDTYIYPLNLTSAKNLICIKVVSLSSALTGLVGGGISRGVKLLLSGDKPVKFVPNTLTEVVGFDDKFAYITAKAQVKSELVGRNYVSFHVFVYNAKNRQIQKKLRRVKVATGVNNIEIKLRLSRFQKYTLQDSYLYTCKMTVGVESEEYDDIVSTFGLRSISYGQTLALNGEEIKLKGCNLTHDNGILGQVSNYSYELRKLTAVKKIGYNAVRYTGVPSENVLNLCDALGLMVVVDIFATFNEAKFPLDWHLTFASSYRETLSKAIYALRSHVCVVMYSLGREIEETLGRNNGLSLIKEMVAIVKSIDDSRPVTIGMCEKVASATELYELGDRSFGKLVDSGEKSAKDIAVELTRQKDFFRARSEAVAKAVDVCGYENLYHRYAVDKLMYKDRRIISLSSSITKTANSYEEANRNEHVWGEMGSRGYEYYDELGNLVEGADFDIIGNLTALGMMHTAINSTEHVAFITTVDPVKAISASEKITPLDCEATWNYPRYNGQNVKVVVFTNDDIVQLSSLGKNVGRKIAGKTNGYRAIFDAPFTSGNLTATTYRKGIERTSVSLISAQAPKAVLLSPSSRKVGLGSEDYIFVEISIVDNIDNVVAYAQREVHLEIIGDGEIVALSSASPNSSSAIDGSVEVYKGKALAIIKAVKEGKFVVKATCEGLNSHRLQFTAKENAK